MALRLFLSGKIRLAASGAGFCSLIVSAKTLALRPSMRHSVPARVASAHRLLPFSFDDG